MNASDRRHRLLDQISDHSAQKIIIMRWWERQEIGDAEAERLIRGRGLAAA